MAKMAAAEAKATAKLLDKATIETRTRIFQHIRVQVDAKTVVTSEEKTGEATGRHARDLHHEEQIEESEQQTEQNGRTGQNEQLTADEMIGTGETDELERQTGIEKEIGAADMLSAGAEARSIATGIEDEIASCSRRNST
jgi:hypothetical protein